MEDSLFEELKANLEEAIQVNKAGKKTIVVGDIHGHVNSVEAALATPYNVVFVGDYLDSFSQTVENQVKCLTMVLDAVEAEPDRVVGLFGNHEMSYLDPSMKCSGYNMETHQYVKHLTERMLKTLKSYHWVGEYLITHAGVDQHLLDQLDVEVEHYLDNEHFYQIGTARGGYDRAGGLYWNDFNNEMTPPNGLKQVVGHSNYTINSIWDGVRNKHSEDLTGVVWCVDNLNRKKEVLMIDGDNAFPYDLLSEEKSRQKE